jgi:hypothetical protein
MREEIVGLAFKENNGGIVYTNAQCSFANGQGNCDATAANTYSITDMDPSTTYYV